MEREKAYSPIIFIVSGPGGVGKSTLVNRLFKKKFFKQNFIRGISFTTRKKRKGEKEGRDYFFVKKDEFLKLKRKKFFLETQKVLDDYYGTPKYFWNWAKRERKALLLCIDVKGGIYLKKKFKTDKIITIFISAPFKELLERLKKRVETKEGIRKKIALAKREEVAARDYNYLIINQNINKTLKKLEKIFRENLKQQ